MRSRLLLGMLAFGGLMTAAACGGGGSNVPKCTPGQAIACVGLGSCQGNQVCAANGAYGACLCGNGTAGTSGGGGRGGSLGTAGATGGSAAAGAGGAGGGAGTTGAGGTAGSAGSAGTTGGSNAGGSSGSGGAAGRGGAAAGAGGSAGSTGTGGATAGAGGSAGSSGSGGASGTAGSGSSCDPVAQTGCGTGQRCTWIVTGTNAGHNACLADGSVDLGGTCSYGATGETTGFDTCKKGLSCIQSSCKRICSSAPDSCATNYACNIHPNSPFDLTGTLGIGFCDPTCNPLTQTRDTDGAAACGSPTPASPTKGCFGFPGGKFTCQGVISTTKTSEMPAGSPAFVNSCAPGYEPLLVDMTGGSTSICVALCKPADTSTTSPANAAGLPGSGYTCPDKGAGTPNECRYWWSFENVEADGLSSYGNTLGFCFDYPHYKYDSNGDSVEDTTDPSCTTLSTIAHNFDTVMSDAEFWNCIAHP